MVTFQRPQSLIPMLRQAYEAGLFPMAESKQAGSAIHLYEPELRAVLRPADFHVSRRLLRFMRRVDWRIVWNDDIRAVMTACGDRPGDSWINAEMIDLYEAWHREGDVFCLSVFAGLERIGGIYGVQLGGVVTAESMFSRRSNASAVGLVVLLAGLAAAGIALVDLQYINDHTKRFGAVEMPQAEYLQELHRLIGKKTVLKADYFNIAGGIAFAQSLSQTS